MADRPKDPPGPPAPVFPQQASRRAVTAERMKAVESDSGARRAAEVLKDGAVGTALNGAGALKDLISDFQGKDSFFKYKALVVVVWAALVSTSIGVGCPGGNSSNSIGARLVTAGEASRPIYMVKNDSSSSWSDVEIIVNGQWRTTATEVATNGDLTLVPRMLANSNGDSAPPELKITEIQVKTSDGEAVLMRGGRAQR